MPDVTVRRTHQYQQEIISGKHVILADDRNC